MTQTKTRKPGGFQPNEHVPTEITRGKVIGFTCAGFNQDRIADYLDIDVSTLTKHYRYELDHAMMEKIDNISQTVYQKAMNGNDDLAKFVLKTKGRWSYARPEGEEKLQETLLEKLIDKL